MNTTTTPTTLDTFTGTISNLPFSALTSSRYEEKTTGRFQPISTALAVDHLQAEGWQIFKASEAKTRLIERRPFVKHQIQLTHPDIKPVNGLQPLVYLQNANDGTSSFSLFAGLFRFICSNGLVIGSSFISARVRHVGNVETIREELQSGAFTVSNQFPSIMEKVDSMLSFTPSPEEKLAFSSLAFNLRFPNKTLPHWSTVPVGSHVRREGDKGSDLWTMYNRTQEDLVTGGFHTGNRRARGIRSLTRSTVINRQLWSLAEKTLNGKIVEEWKAAKQLSLIASSLN
jgi:hypothetical protein